MKVSLSLARSVYRARGALEMIYGVCVSHLEKGPIYFPLTDRRHPLEKNLTHETHIPPKAGQTLMKIIHFQSFAVPPLERDRLFDL